MKRAHFKCIVMTWQEDDFGRTIECCIPLEKEQELLRE